MSIETTEMLIIGGIVAIGLIAVGRGIGRELAMRRGRPYDAGKPIGARIPPEAQDPGQP
jgi:hypothetical protein